MKLIKVLAIAQMLYGVAAIAQTQEEDLSNNFRILLLRAQKDKAKREDKKLQITLAKIYQELPSTTKGEREHKQKLAKWFSNVFDGISIDDVLPKPPVEKPVKEPGPIIVKQPQGTQPGTLFSEDNYIATSRQILETIFQVVSSNLGQAVMDIRTNPTNAIFVTRVRNMYIALADASFNYFSLRDPSFTGDKVDATLKNSITSLKNDMIGLKNDTVTEALRKLGEELEGYEAIIDKQEKEKLYPQKLFNFVSSLFNQTLGSYFNRVCTTYEQCGTLVDLVNWLKKLPRVFAGSEEEKGVNYSFFLIPFAMLQFKTLHCVSKGQCDVVDPEGKVKTASIYERHQNFVKELFPVWNTLYSLLSPEYKKRATSDLQQSIKNLVDKIRMAAEAARRSVVTVVDPKEKEARDFPRLVFYLLIYGSLAQCDPQNPTTDCLHPDIQKDTIKSALKTFNDFFSYADVPRLSPEQVPFALTQLEKAFRESEHHQNIPGLLGAG